MSVKWTRILRFKKLSICLSQVRFFTQLLTLFIIFYVLFYFYFSLKIKFLIKISKPFVVAQLNSFLTFKNMQSAECSKYTVIKLLFNYETTLWCEFQKMIDKMNRDTFVFFLRCKKWITLFITAQKK